MSLSRNSLELLALEIFEKSLDLPSNERQAWILDQTQNNMELQEKALSLLAQDSSKSSEFQTGRAHLLLEEVTPPEKVGAYKVISLIGQGGMGAVFLGERDTGDFDHKVAIKIIRQGVLSEALIERFQRERQILANFSHTNIARLLDGGTLDDGSPYFIMEYIEGTPISKWVQAESSSLKQRLKLIKDICDAVSYAHQNLIIHRDITPSNVLVTRESTVKLIDFGIAKNVDDPAPHQTTKGSLSGLSFTPGYAAPERAQGAPANTLADIYSVGRLMEELLADFKLPDDLQSIWSKATSINPDKRYSTIAKLKEDIDSFLNGHTVSSYNATPLYRVMKFIKRHMIPVSLSALAMVSITGGLIGTTYLYQKAEQAREEADTRFNEVRELSNFLIFDLFDELQPIAGTTPALAMISDKSKTYLDRLSSIPGASIDLQRETADGYRRLSDVLGNPRVANLGEREKSIELLKTAHAKLSLLHDQHPNDIEITRALAASHFSYIGIKFIALDDNQGAATSGQNSAKLYKSLIDKDQATIIDKDNYLLAKAYSGIPYVWLGEGEKAISILRETLAEAKVVLEQHPEEGKLIFTYGVLHKDLAETMMRHFDATEGNYQETLPHFNQAISILTELSSKSDDQSQLNALMRTHYLRSQTFYGLENNEAALQDLSIAQSIAEAILEKDPENANMQRNLRNMLSQRASTLSEMQRFKEAIQLGKLSLSEIQKAFNDDPNSSGRHREYTYGLYLLGDIYRLAGQQQKSCTKLNEARQEWTLIEERYGISEYDRSAGYAPVIELLENCL